MRVYDEKAYEWNHAVAPYGNLGRVNPTILSRLLDEHNIPWYTTAWPYSSGLNAYCPDEKLWKKLRDMAVEN